MKNQCPLFPTRRALLGAGAAFSLAAAWPAHRAQAQAQGPAQSPAQAQGHVEFGPVRPPVAAPALRLTGTDGKPWLLPSALEGRITALQLMFTGCSATCPIQGAAFADAQQKLEHDAADLRLLSVSIDPLGDDRRALAAWLARYGAKPQRWTAALPRAQDVDPLLDFVRGRASGADRHTPQIYLFDRRARLVYRTADLPSGEQLALLMRQIATLGKQ